MISLDSYLRGPFKDDAQFQNRLHGMINDVVPIFLSQTITLPVSKGASQTVATWRYAVPERRPGRVSLSFSTHCMILFALDAFRPRGKNKYSILLGKSFWPSKLRDKADLDEVINRAMADLIGALNLKPEPLVASSTYGENDPFTLTWLAELAFRWPDGALHIDGNDLKSFAQAIRTAAHHALDRAEILSLQPAGEGFAEIPSTFLQVRRLHLAHAIDRLEQEAGLAHEAMKKIEGRAPWREFDSTIHRHLSYSSMRDPRFDPAELAFAFEGALLQHSHWVSSSTVDKVFEALSVSNERQPFWRAVSPFLLNDRGHALFLISVEIANSILRACEVLDDDAVAPRRFSEIEPQLRSYATWLLQEAVRVPDPTDRSKNMVGWRTEYSDEREHETIHLWHTSHVLVFLAHYQSLLRRKIAADGVDAAGLQVIPPGQKPKITTYWDDEPLRSLATDDQRPYAVLATVRNKYLAPRNMPEADSEAPRSMVLFGPPGTGKTTLAEQMAANLNWPLIVVTVSDFLATGASELENRAKGVFEVLRSQSAVLILFDEVDQFLLDRNSSFYQTQSDVFKFMTPGMLTKLQNLRDVEGCIFIVATNYFERVDSAIKRRGRIDDHFLLCVPDRAQRTRLLKRFLLGRFKSILKDEETRATYERAAGTVGSVRDFLTAVSGPNFPDKQFETLLDSKGVLTDTVHFGWGDLKYLVESQLVVQPGIDFETLADALARAADRVEPAASLRAYAARFQGDGPYPFEEFFLVAYLMVECKKPFSASDEKVIRRVLELIPEFKGANFELLLEEGYIRDPVVSAALKRPLQPYFK